MNIFKQVIISMRPKQWIKNLFIGAPIVFSQGLSNVELLLKVCSAIGIFCILCGANYIFNDLIDVENDRKHPQKALRPIASGKLDVTIAKIIGLSLIIGGLIGAFSLPIPFGLVAISYLGLSWFYSSIGKHMIIIDILCVSFGFVLRVVAGGVSIGVENISPWLFICTMLLALFLSLCKRRHELILLEEEAQGHRLILKEYTPVLIDEMISAVTGSTIIAYSLYAFDKDVALKVHSPFLPLTIPFVLYGIFRYLYLVHHKKSGGSPEIDIMRDKPLIVAIIMWISAILGIIYL